jgi:hypothetical protein
VQQGQHGSVNARDHRALLDFLGTVPYVLRMNSEKTSGDELTSQPTVWFTSLFG